MPRLRPKGLPDFDDPPVAEVILGLQFALMGAFGAVQMIVGPQVPRYMFRSENGAETVRFQPDRFVLNWGRMSLDASCPRYAPLIDRFQQEPGRIGEFLGSGTTPCPPMGTGHPSMLPCTVPWSGAAQLRFACRSVSISTRVGTPTGRRVSDMRREASPCRLSRGFSNPVCRIPPLFLSPAAEFSSNGTCLRSISRFISRRPTKANSGTNASGARQLPVRSPAILARSASRLSG